MKFRLLFILTCMLAVNAKGEITPNEIIQESLPRTLSGEQVQIGRDFKFTFSPEDYHPLKSEIGDLNVEELGLFKQRRRFIINQVARILSFKNTRSGIGMVEGDKLTMVQDGQLNKNPVEALAEVESDKSSNKRHKLLLKIMTSVDNFIFQNARTAISSNEYGLDLALSVGSVVGGRGKYILGGALGIQFTFGFDMQSKRVVFQVKLFTEKATSGITGIFMPIGITPRIGGYMRASTKAPTSYDITFVPVAPMYIAKSNGMAAIGATAAVTGLSVVSAGLASFLESAMAYKSHTKTVTIIDSETIRLKFAKFDHMVHAFKQSIRPQSVSCGGLLFN